MMKPAVSRSFNLEDIRKNREYNSLRHVQMDPEGEADEWMTELRGYLERNLQDTLDFIENHHLPLVPYRPEASFLLWVDCSQAGIGKENLNQFFMDRAHIHLDDGEEHFGTEGKGFVRINFAVTNKMLKTALDRIDAVL